MMITINFFNNVTGCTNHKKKGNKTDNKKPPAYNVKIDFHNACLITFLIR